MSETFTQEVSFGSWLLGTLLESATLKIRRSIISTASISGLTLAFDTRFGITDPTSGWTTLPLKATAKRIWCNSISGNDANDGLTAATAKATFAAAFNLYIAGYTAGDQLMFAQGGTYTDPGGLNSGNGIRALVGDSYLYPAAFISYDPALPSDTSKYGRALGATRPKILIPDSNSVGPAFAMPGAAGGGLIMWQGLELDGQDIAGNQISFAGLHSGLRFQNCLFKTVEPSIVGNDTAPFNDGISFSFCAHYGQWASTGNASGCFTSGTTNATFEDCVIGHGGWRMSATRSTTDATLGGPNVFGHGNYLSAHNDGVTYRRCVFFDNAADGFNARGNVTGSGIVTIKDPFAGVIGGVSSSITEAPSGTVVQVTDMLVMGRQNIASNLPRDGGFNNRNTAAASKISNVLMIESGFFDNVGETGIAVNSHAEESAEISSQLVIDRLTTYRWSHSINTITGAFPAKPTQTFQNCKTDVAITTSSQATATNCAIINPAVDIPNHKTPLQIYTSLAGITNEWDLFNWMIEYPHLPWAQGLLSTAFTAYNKVADTLPLLNAISLASLTSPRLVYDTSTPTLVSPTGAAATSVSATVGGTVNKVGTLYAILSTSSTKPTAAQVKAGQNAAGVASPNGSKSIPGSGVQTMVVGGATASTTYFAHLMFEDGQGLQTAVATSASFATGATTLGPELLTNGTFASASAPPTVGSGCTISGGVLNCTNAATIATWSTVLTAGQTYRVQLDYNELTGHAANLRVEDGAGIRDIKTITSDNTTHTVVFTDFVASGTSVIIAADSDFYFGTIDNVSCKQVT